MIENFYKNNRRRLINKIARMCGGDRTFAEDVLQEAFTKAIRFYPVYDPEQGEFSTWFNTILYRTFFDMQAKEKSVVFKPDTDLSLKDVLDASKFTSEEVALEVERAVSLVRNEKHRKVVELFYIYGYTAREISFMLDKTTVTAVSTIVMRFRGGLN